MVRDDGTLQSDKAHVHVPHVLLVPPFLAALFGDSANPFGGSCDGGWDEFADVRFSCSRNSSFSVCNAPDLFFKLSDSEG